MQPRILRRLITHAAFALIVQNQISCSELHARADSVAIGLGPDQQNLQPVVRIAAIVAQKLRRLAIIADQNIELAIVVEIADRSTSAHARKCKVGPKLIADIFESAAASVPE